MDIFRTFFYKLNITLRVVADQSDVSKNVNVFSAKQSRGKMTEHFRRFGAADDRRLGGPASATNIKYAKMYHFEKKNSKIFSSEGPSENVCGPCENVSPDPAVALDGPDL